jgi:hypothetical protein
VSADGSVVLSYQAEFSSASAVAGSIWMLQSSVDPEADTHVLVDVRTAQEVKQAPQGMATYHVHDGKGLVAVPGGDCDAEAVGDSYNPHKCVLQGRWGVGGWEGAD